MEMDDLAIVIFAIVIAVYGCTMFGLGFLGGALSAERGRLRPMPDKGLNAEAGRVEPSEQVRSNDA
jgi:hypothetical protein